MPRYRVLAKAIRHKGELVERGDEFEYKEGDFTDNRGDPWLSGLRQTWDQWALSLGFIEPVEEETPAEPSSEFDLEGPPQED